jgi:hypothetical protein
MNSSMTGLLDPEPRRTAEPPMPAVIRQQFDRAKSRGFGVVCQNIENPAFKAYNSFGDEFSLSVAGEICIFAKERPNTSVHTGYPRNSEEFLRTLANFLGYVVVEPDL